MSKTLKAQIRHLHYYEGLSSGEIAAKLDISEWEVVKVLRPNE